MGGIYGGKDIRPISQKQDSLHGLINTILDKLPLGVFVKDAEDGFRYLYWNRFMEEITGIGTEEVEGHNDFELSFDAIMPAEERLGLDRDVMETGRTIEFSGKISDAYGIPKDIEVTKFPIALSNGKPLLLALWRDVTVRNKMENTLRRSQVLTKMALHSNDIRLCSIFVNPDSKRNYDDSVVQVNNWLPGKEDELVDISWPRFAARVHPDDRERHDEAFRKLCSGEISEMKIELRVKYPGMDRYHWRESSATVYERDERGRVLVILGCTINIQERKGQELNLEEAKHKAELADKMKSKYLADMSHEIRTPLNAIVGFAHLVTETTNASEQREYFSIINKNCDLLLKQINDILDLSKIESGRLNYNVSEVELRDICQEAYVVQSLKMTSDVALLYNSVAMPSVRLWIDPHRVEQVLLNLLSNAIKFTSKGFISLFYEVEDMFVRVSVMDTGIGISEEKLESVFERFVKLDDFYQGAGLGLPICKMIVEQLGGEIGVRSELGKGSTFWFTLPLVVTDKAVVEKDDPSVLSECQLY